MEYKLIPSVYVFESPDPSDIQNNRIEGPALSAALQLMGFQCKNYCIHTKNEFQEQLKNISQPQKYNIETHLPCLIVPVLHISAHGCETGFALTSGERISWCELSSLLSPINEKCFHLLFLSMSVCYGFSAVKSVLSLRLPFYFLIGATNEVEWGKSLLAFLVFYYNFEQIIENEHFIFKSINDVIHQPNLFKVCFAEEAQSKFITAIKNFFERFSH